MTALVVAAKNGAVRRADTRRALACKAEEVRSYAAAGFVDAFLWDPIASINEEAA